MAPPAVLIAPSAFPLRFAEVVNFKDDFGVGQVVNPKGIAYYPPFDTLIVSLSPNDVARVNPPRTRERAQHLTSVSAEGGRAPIFESFRMHRDVESLIAVVPATGPSVTMAHFTPGDVFVGRGPGGEIARLKPAAVNEVFANVGSQIWGGLTFDTVGRFGGELIVLTYGGSVFRVNNVGVSRPITTLPASGLEYEGVAVAPMSFGPYGGWIIVGVEGQSDDNPEAGKVYAIDPSHPNDAPQLLAHIPHTTEHIQFVPPKGGTYYQTELCFHRVRENRLWKASASQFLGRPGRMLVVNELGNELWEVAWDRTRYTQSLVGRVPGPWTSEGYKFQGTELEAGCFATLPPVLPIWANWSPVPGGATTDRCPAVALDAHIVDGRLEPNLHLLIKGVADRRIYMNSMWGTTRAWTGWAEVPGGATSNHAPAAVLHNQVTHVFAVRDDGAVWHKHLFDQNSSLLDSPWREVPGAWRTDAAVAATNASGRLVLAAKGIADGLVYLNELAPGGRAWSGWSPVPNCTQTNASPALAAYQDELYVFVKDMSGLIRTKVRSENSEWTDWAELPGSPVTTNVQAAATTQEGQLYVFATGTDRSPYYNVASTSGTWCGWRPMPNGGATNLALAAAPIGNYIYLFAAGTLGEIYMRYNPTGFGRRLDPFD